MTRRLYLAGAALVLLSVAVAAQQKPNFSGTWVVVTPERSAGQEEVIRQDETTFSTGHASNRGGHNFVYKLDGTESRNVLSPHPGEEIVTLATATWQGETLVITERATFPDGRKKEQTSTYSLDDQGLLRLSIERSADGKPEPSVTLVYKKKG
jgi:hypothetical protein